MDAKNTIAKLRIAIKQLANDKSLLVPHHFEQRAEAIDFIDFHIIDHIDALFPQADKQPGELRHAAEQLKNQLVEIDNRHFAGLRQQLLAITNDGAQFMKMVRSYVSFDIDAAHGQGKIGYDTLDLFIDGLLTTHPLPETTAPLQTDMIFYQKTPARVVFEIVAKARITTNDVFFDIGSGLGQVAILVNLLSGANTTGVESDAALCHYSALSAQALQLNNISFINTNALQCDYSEGTIFFLYSPFKGDMLKQMLIILKKQAAKRSIRIYTYGPCSAVVNQEEWLDCADSSPMDVYKVYEFRSK